MHFLKTFKRDSGICNYAFSKNISSGRHCFVLRPAALTASLFLLQAFSGAVTISYYTSIIFGSFANATIEGAHRAQQREQQQERMSVQDDGSMSLLQLSPSSPEAAGAEEEGLATWLEYGGTISVGITYVAGQ